MTLIERLLATAVYGPNDLDCRTLRRVDQLHGFRDTEVILISLETRDEILAALSDARGYNHPI